MLALLLSLPFAIHAADGTERAEVYHVDLIVINQYYQVNECDGKWQGRVTWYTSYFDLLWSPPTGLCRMPVWVHRGWRKTEPLLRCDEGWADLSSGKLVIGRRAILVVSDYDFEYRHRTFYFPINP